MFPSFERGVACLREVRNHRASAPNLNNSDLNTLAPSTGGDADCDEAFAARLDPIGG